MLNYAKVVRAHSLDKLKLFHHLAKLEFVDRTQILIAFNTDDVYNDWKDSNAEAFENLRQLREVGESMRSSEGERKSRDEEKTIVEPFLEQTETFFNLSQKRNYISSFSMADLLQVPTK